MARITNSVIWFLLAVFTCISRVVAEDCDGYDRTPIAEGFIQWTAWGVVLLCLAGLLTCALKDSKRHSMEDV